MSNSIKFLALAVLLFSLAAGASWYLQSKQTAETEGQAGAEDKPAKAPATPHAKTGSTEPSSTRPLIRPPLSTDADRMAQVASTLHQQQEALKGREQQMMLREKQMDLIHLEIKQQQKKLDVTRKEIQAELQLVQDKLEVLEKKTAEVDKKRDQVARESGELDGKKTELNGLEATNLKKLSIIYDKMEPEAAAQAIEQMVEKGKLEMAVVILTHMGQRQAANLLTEVSKQDPGMAVQLMDRMRYVKTAQISAK